MELTEIRILDQVTIDEFNVILFRYKNKIMRGEEEIASTYERGSVAPGQDVSSFDVKVQEMANLFWTEQVITDYQNMINSQIQDLNIESPAE